jgi:hypothetical protein
MVQKLTAAERRLFNKVVKAYAKIKSRAGKKHFAKNVYATKNKEVKLISILALVRVNKIKAKLGMSDKERDYLGESVAMHQAILDDVDGFFSTLFVDLGLWDAQNIRADQALRDIGLKVANAEEAKKTAFSDLAITLDGALAYVNNIVRRNQRQAVDIIAAACMHQVLKGEKNKPDFSAEIGGTPGTAKLTALVPVEATKKLKCTFFWCYSYDNGITWSLYEIMPTHQAKTIATGLENKPVIFRKRILTKNGFTDWVVSPPITPK